MEIYLFVAIILLFIFLITPSMRNKSEFQDFFMQQYAHRGIHTGEKKTGENTLDSFQRAIDLKVGIELDIQMTRDGELVVFHDDDLNRLCGIDRFIRDMSLVEVSQITIKNSGEKIPTFKQVLELINMQVPILIEIKNQSKNRPEVDRHLYAIEEQQEGKRIYEKEDPNMVICEKLMGILSSYNGTYGIQSFNPYILKWFRKHYPKVLRGQLSGPVHELKKELPVWKSFLLANLLLNCISRPDFISYYKNNSSAVVPICSLFGAKWFVWTIRGEKEIQKYKKGKKILIFEL